LASGGYDKKVKLWKMAIFNNKRENLAENTQEEF
jgi:hypothetical protein